MVTPGGAPVPVTVTTQSDNVAESSETFQIQITEAGGSSIPCAITPNQDVATVTITDVPPFIEPEAQLTVLSETVVEGQSTVLLAVTQVAGASSCEVDVTSIPGTGASGAVLNADYQQVQPSTIWLHRAVHRFL